jgi:hypothetical protein
VWSADNVKRRKLEDDEAAEAIRRMTLDKNRLVRAKVLRQPLMGGFLDREYGITSPETVSASFVGGILQKGTIPLAHARWSSNTNIKHMYIDDRGGTVDVCTALASKLSPLACRAAYLAM